MKHLLFVAFLLLGASTAQASGIYGPFVGPGVDGSQLNVTATGGATHTLADWQAYVTPISGSAAAPFSIGSSLYPVYLNATSATATTTNGAYTFTCVSGCSNITVGKAIYNGSIWPRKNVVTDVTGSTITTTQAATQTNASPVTIQVGYNRWNTTSSVVANMLGTKNIWNGAASVGNSNWVENYLTDDCQEPLKVASCFLGNGGSISSFFGGRLSDVTIGTAYPMIMTEYLAINDRVANPQTIWAQYIETHAEAGAAVGKQTFGVENSMYNLNAAVTADPWAVNQGTGTVNERLDCGIGSGSPLACDHALDIINNGSTYGTGIIVRNGALSTGTLTHPPAISLPSGSNGYGLDWYRQTGYSTPSWQVYSTNTTTDGNNFIFGDADFRFSDASNVYFIASKSIAQERTSGSAPSFLLSRLDLIASGGIGQLVAQGLNASSATKTYGQINFNVVANTAGAEDGSISLQVSSAGTVTTEARLTKTQFDLQSGVALSEQGVNVIDSSSNASFAGLTATGTSTLGVINASGAETISTNGALSVPPLLASGTWITGGSGTTTRPQVLIEPTGTTANNWNTNGTGLGINAASGFSGNLIDVQVANVLKFKVGNGGNPTFTGLITGQSGATLTGATAINKNNNAATEIGDGTTTSTVTIGGGSNAVVINSTTGGSIATGAITGTTLNGNTFTTGTYTLTGSAGKTLNFTDSATLGTNTILFPGGGNVTVTFPTSADTLVGKATTDTLTNKTINLTSNTLTATSAQLAASITDETGSGAAVFGTSPTIATPALTGTGTYAQLNGTSTSSTCLTQGANGTTNPVLQIDCSVGSQATGVKLTGNAAGTAATLAAISSGSNEDLGLAGKGTGGVAITGRTSGSAAAAGKVGEVIKSYVVTGSAVSLTTATSTNITSISLTAGDWDVCGAVNFKTTAATSTVTLAGISTTSATMPTDGTEVYSGVQLTLTTTTDGISIPCKQVNVSATTTAYLEAQATFSAGSISAFGQLFARRKE